MVKRIAALLVMLLMISTLTMTAYAQHPVPDLTQNGRITFVMDFEGELLDGGNLKMYRIGNIVEYDGNYSFKLIDELDGSDVVLDDMYDEEDAKRLLTIAKVIAEDAGLIEATAPIEEGAAVFNDLHNGLYVVWQDDADATKGFQPIQPFLISVPKFQNGQYVLDVIADPKVPLETTPPPTTNPTTPTKPGQSLPQTGQLNWPVPVLALSGAAMLIAGLILRTAGKKESADA